MKKPNVIKQKIIQVEQYEIYDSQVNYIEITEKDMKEFKHRATEKEAKEPLPIESNPAEFVKAIKEELKYLGMNFQDLAKSSYISWVKMQVLMRGKSQFSKEEAKEIKRVLNID